MLTFFKNFQDAFDVVAAAIATMPHFPTLTFSGSYPLCFVPLAYLAQLFVIFHISPTHR